MFSLPVSSVCKGQSPAESGFLFIFTCSTLEDRTNFLWSLAHHGNNSGVGVCAGDGVVGSGSDI